MTGSVAVSVTSLCSPVNGVAVLRHQTPNLHCCSPEYDYVITAQWASLGVEMDKTPGGNFLDILCCK